MSSALNHTSSNHRAILLSGANPSGSNPKDDNQKDLVSKIVKLQSIVEKAEEKSLLANEKASRLTRRVTELELSAEEKDAIIANQRKELEKERELRNGAEKKIEKSSTACKIAAAVLFVIGVIIGILLLL